ncbi:MAG: site-specific integrase, partial [Gammaproteobacteria bacterium]
MALCKRNNIWWIRISHNGKRIQRSTGTINKITAQELHDQLKADLWRQSKLGEKPEHTWQEAVVKWLRICKRKSMRSLKEAGFQLMWVDPYLKNKKLSEINTDLIDKIIDARRKGNVSNATMNRLLEVIRAVLNNAFKKGWVTKTPFITLFDEIERDRWLTKNEAERLLKELPSHLSDMAAFTLLTGLRKSNV